MKGKCGFGRGFLPGSVVPPGKGGRNKDISLPRVRGNFQRPNRTDNRPDKKSGNKK